MRAVFDRPHEKEAPKIAIQQIRRFLIEADVESMLEQVDDKEDDPDDSVDGD